jgi:hypothetical protein
MHHDAASDESYCQPLEGLMSTSTIGRRMTRGPWLGLGLLPALIAVFAGVVAAQTNPAPQALPYSQDFSSLAHASTTFPAGWQGWVLSSTPGSAYNTAGPTGDKAMLGSSTAATTTNAIHNYDGKIGPLNSSGQDNALALAINTTGAFGVQVAWDAMTIRNVQDGSNNRINGLSLQYRVGTSGTWTTLAGTEYQNNTTNQTAAVTTPQNVQPFSVTLPAACDNQAEVQLRWAQRQISGAGSRPGFAVDNVTVSGGPTTHTVTATAGPNGSIAPSGATVVNTGDDLTLTLTPDPCYSVADVVVDGGSVGAVTSYTFTNITADHTISATFALSVYAITATAGTGGSITPNGAVAVNCGADQAFAIAADPGYFIADVVVDGGSVGAVTGYTFTNVQANHTIAATFTAYVHVPVVLDRALFSTPASGGFTADNGQQAAGNGAWYYKKPGAASKAEVYISPATHLGASFTVDDIESVSYHTYNINNPSPVEYYVVVYTAGAAHGWYEQRLIGEPYLQTGSYSPVQNAWSVWSTAGAGALTLNDNNNSGNQGFYGAPTLADVQAGPITWSTWPGNPTAGGASATPIDYGPQGVLAISFQTGSGWTGFEGYLDRVTIALKNGTIYDVDFEATPYVLTTAVVGNGVVNATPAGPYAHGTPVQVTAVADPGWAFAGWSGDLSGAVNPETITMDFDKSVTATFIVAAAKNLTTGNIFSTIQAAIDDAGTVDGHTIEIYPGTFEEQVHVTKSVTLDGAGCGTTVIRSPAVLPRSFSTGVDNKPVIFVDGAAGATIRELTVDGAGRGNSNYRFVGIGYWNSGGAVVDVCVERIEDTPFSGTQHGVGVYANNNTGGPYALELDRVRVTDFQKTAIALNGAGLTVNVHDCVTIGKGYTSVTAQNGIQISFGASGTVANCAISEIGYSPATWVASGLLTYQAGTVDASGFNGANAITNVQAPVSWYDTNGSMTGFEVSGGADFGPIFIYNSNAALAAGTRTASRARPQVQPLDAAAAGVRGGATDGTLAAYAVTVQNSCLTGTDGAGTVGVWAYTEGGALAVVAQNNEIHDWDYGLATTGAAATLTANANSISSNGSAGYDNTGSGAAQDAETNWWGAADGPSGAGTGSGDAVLGATVDFDPWLHSAADANAGCGFTVVTHTVTASAGGGGTIAPAGATVVNDGDDLTYTITPDACYAVADVVVDGVSQGAVASYTFANVTADHTIAATFAPLTYTITATAGPGGSVTPSGAVSVACGADQGFTIAADPGYAILDVVVDGGSVGAVAAYAFTDVQADHTIAATFVALSYTLTVTTAGSGSVGIAPLQPTYAYGETVTLTATPDPGWHLDGWSGDAAGIANPLAVTMDGNKAITATFLQNIYTWNQSGTAAWTTPANWTPTRHAPSADDVLRFDSGVTTNATGVPAQTIGQLFVSGGTDVTLTPAAAVTLSIAGGAGTDLEVGAGSTLRVTAATALQISLGATATGTVGGTVAMSGAAHRLLSGAAGALVFQGGSLCTQGSPFSGNFFGTTSLNSVVFQAGSIFSQSAGSNPFGASAPSAVVVFQTGSRFRLDGNITPSLSGRTYADFEHNTSGPTNNTGGQTCTMDHIYVTQGVWNVNLTGQFNVRGNVNVSPGATLNFNPAIGSTPMTSFVGGLGSPQVFTNHGTFSMVPHELLEINHPLGVHLATDLPLAGGLTFTSGLLVTGSNALVTSATGQTMGASQSTGWVHGNVRSALVPVAGAITKKFDVGDAGYYAPVTVAFTDLAGPFDLTANTTTPDHPNLATSTIDGAKSVNRWWTLAPAGTPAFTTCTATFGFHPADVDGGADPGQVVVERFEAGSWSPTGAGARTATSTQATGVTGFGDFAVGENVSYTITATAGPGGTITPSGPVSVVTGCGATFAIAPDPCHAIADVVVDGVSQGPITSYTFTGVTADHAIDATFAALTYTITVTAGAGGSIAPTGPGGVVTVPCGGSQAFAIAADPGFAVADVKVDGVSQGAIASYTFTNVTADHTIAATFADVQGPVVTVLAPNGGENLIVGSTVTLSWTATDNGGPIATVDLLISRNFGASYSLIGDDVPNTGTYAWVVTGPGTNVDINPVHSALFRVRAYDAGDLQGVDVSDAPFSIYDLVVETIVVRFEAVAADPGMEVRWQIATPELFASVGLERGDGETGPWTAVDAERRVEGDGVVAADRTALAGRTYWYRLAAVTNGGSRVFFGPVRAEGAVVREFELTSVSPNPAFGPVRVDFAVARESPVDVAVLDVQGRVVATLLGGVQRAGRYQAVWDGSAANGRVPAGIYFVRYQGGGRTFVKKFVLAR